LRRVAGVNVVGPLLLKAADFVAKGTKLAHTHWVVESPKNINGRNALVGRH
jgi:hypothetical protein